MKHAVLLVDDDRALLDGLRRALYREPYQLLVAEGAGKALEVLAARSVDVVVSDEGMPGLSGTEFLAQVQAEYPETIRFMLTGQASLGLAIRAINRGHVFRFFTKPCNPVELGIALRQALQQRALMQKSRRLLETVRRQSALLDDEPASLVEVQRDASGAVVVPDVATDLDALLEEVEAELQSADRRLAAHRIRARPHDTTVRSRPR
jgi:two-component system, probable response regulator PhcQ